MRFFAHDGTTTHGPLGVDDLLKLPGFDGDTLVCPVGSADSADWKPALAYPPFKKALLEAPAAAAARAPEPALPPMPFFPPPAAMPVPSAFPLPLSAPPVFEAAPAPTPRTVPCRSCAHANLEDAKFCNACGARMDGGAPEPILPSTPAAPAAPPAPAESDPFAHLDPMLSYPAEPAPMSFSEPPRRPLQPGKMGQLSSFEEEVSSPAPALAPEPVAATAPAWKSPSVIAAFVGAAVLVGGVSYFMMRKPALPADTVAELNPSATPMPSAEPAPAPPPPVVFNTAPPPAPPPIRIPKSKKKAKTPKLGAPTSFEAPALSAKPKRTRKPRTPRVAPPPETASGGDTMIESRAEDKPVPVPKKKRGKKAAVGGEDPLLESLLADATQPSGKPAEEAAPSASQPIAEPGAEPAERSAPKIGQRPSGNPGKFSLPGLERPVSASDRTPPPGNEEAPAALAEPGKAAPPPPPPGIEDEPAKSAEGDQLALVQVHEQFDFCAQLLAQGAYGDHYDTCLCKDTRDAAPTRGRRGFYVSAKKKEASAGKLDTTAKILSSKLEGGSAIVKAKWKNGGADRGHDVSQTWKLEDGLWCQAP